MIVRPRPQSSVGLAVTLAVGKHGPRERQRAYLRRILPWATVQSAGGRSPRRDQRHALWGELVGPGCCRGRAHCHGLRLWNFCLSTHLSRATHEAWRPLCAVSGAPGIVIWSRL